VYAARDARVNQICPDIAISLASRGSRNILARLKFPTLARIAGSSDPWMENENVISDSNVGRDWVAGIVGRLYAARKISCANCR